MLHTVLVVVVVIAQQSLAVKPIERYVEEKGYPIQVVEIETSDGFKLRYHRIPHGKSGSGHGHPVLLAHGILQSSALYLAMDDGLAYLLADAGFDVWLTNVRGNMYSKKHKKLKPSSKEFWDFSFHEMGALDLPAAIDFILATTGRPSLSYVGFSMGNTMFWVLADTWGSRYMDLVDTMVAIAPIARPSRMKVVQRPKIYKALRKALSVRSRAHLYEVRSFHTMEASLLRGTCGMRWFRNRLCTRMLAGLVGLFPDYINYEDTYQSTQYMPAGTSVKTLEHFMQIAGKGSFQQYDYGEKENPNHYKHPPYPPVYDLNKVTCPVFFVNSQKDSFSVIEDVDWLSNQLPEKPQKLFFDAVKDFEHLDFFYNKNVKQDFFEPLVNFISERKKLLEN